LGSCDWSHRSIIYYLEKEFSVYALHRHNYLKKRDAHRRTVLVESIPRKLRSNVALATFFEILYPNAIERVRVCQDVRHLDKLVEQQQSVLASLERSLTRAALGKKHPLTFVGLALESTESIEYYQEELDASNRLIALEQKYASRLAYASDIRGRDEACRIVEHYLDVHDPQVMTKLMNERGVSPKEWVKMMEYPEDDDVEGEKKDNERSVRQSVRKPSDAELEQLPFFDWWREIWHSKSWSDAVEVFVSGRSVEYSFKADESTRLIAPPTAAPEQENLRFLSKAFITFKTFTAATTARQVLHIQLPGRLAIQEAPQGSDIIWSNMYTTRRSKMFRSFVVDILIIWMIVLWIVPITLASLILSASALRSKHHHLNELCQESSFLASLIQFIQPITLVLLMELWPITLAELARISGIVSYSKCQKVVFTRYFTFQVINVFLVSTIAGSVLNSLYLVIQNPSVTFTQLGSSLPKMAGFFMSYTLFKALIGLGLEISRLLAFLGVLLKRLITPHMSPRDQDAGYGIMRNMNNPGWFPHAKFYAQDMLIVLVMMTFSCIAPLCLIAGIIYFAGAAYVYKHQMLYVYEPIFESGGTYWPALARRFVFSLFMSQMTMIGMLILKESYDPIYVLVLLMFCTFLYSRRVEALYGRFAEDLPFDQATALDLEMRDIPVQLVGIEEFIQPSLRAPVDVKPILDSSVIKDTNA